MNQHTPGPWFVIFGDNDEGDRVYGIEAKNGSDIVITDSGFYPPRGADAYLIAAAPELLDALLAVETHHVELNRMKGRDELRSTTLRIVRAAIAKATPPASPSPAEQSLGEAQTALSVKTEAKTKHTCRRSRTCCCDIAGLEPSEDCPVHGCGEWPPRCEECGKFLPFNPTPPEGKSANSSHSETQEEPG